MGYNVRLEIGGESKKTKKTLADVGPHILCRVSFHGRELDRWRNDYGLVYGPSGGGEIEKHNSPPEHYRVIEEIGPIRMFVEKDDSA